LGVVGSVEEMAVMDECGGAATVEVDGLTGAEVGHELGELGERESDVDTGPSAVTDECDQFVSGGTECSPWVAAGGDVGVELVGAGDESLGIVQVAEGGAVPDEHWAGLEQVAGWARRQLGTRADVDLPLVDVDRRPRSSVRVENRLRLDPAAADPQLAERRPVRADEEAADDRFRDARSSAPAVESLRDGEVLDAQARLRTRVPHDVDGCLHSVSETMAEKVIPSSERLHRHPLPDASNW
jgi:hypothetical protein